jgi:hypothetical protein
MGRLDTCVVVVVLAATTVPRSSNPDAGRAGAGQTARDADRRLAQSASGAMPSA